MTTTLLDVNVLVALAWPNHVHHEAVAGWFQRHAGAGWATTPLTESGFIRVSSNPALHHAVTPLEAMALLERLREIDVHRFLDDDVSLVTSPHVDRARIVSYRHVTDAHLTALARRHGGRLATLDRGVHRLYSRGETDHTVVVISGTS